MSATKKAATFTPGPWSSRSEESGNYEVKDEHGRWVARVHFRDAAKDGAASCNARLIAAAPDLLAALEALRDWDDHPAMNGRPDGTPVPETTPSFDKTIKMVHAAIAKARGGA